MESLSGNQVKDLKELYASIYKSDDQEISEEEMKDEKKNIKKEIEDKKIEKEAEKKEEPITINLPNGGTKKIYPASDEYKKIKSGELTTSKSNSSMTTDITNIKKNEKGEYSGTVEKPKVSAMGVDVNKVDVNKVDVNKVDVNKNEVKKEKPLLSKPIKLKTDLGSDIRQVKPSSARDKMIAKNEIKLGGDRVNLLRKQNADFQAMKKGDITKADFIKQYPKSQTAIKSKLKALESYEPYDVVLDYVLSEGHADTVEEAHYVMIQMDADTIQGIVEMKGGSGSPYIINQADVNASTEAFKNFQKGMKNKITGEDLYKLAPGVKLPKV